MTLFKTSITDFASLMEGLTPYISDILLIGFFMGYTLSFISATFFAANAGKFRRIYNNVFLEEALPGWVTIFLSTLFGPMQGWLTFYYILIRVIIIFVEWDNNYPVVWKLTKFTSHAICMYLHVNYICIVPFVFHVLWNIIFSYLEDIHFTMMRTQIMPQPPPLRLVVNQRRRTSVKQSFIYELFRKGAIPKLLNIPPNDRQTVLDAWRLHIETYLQGNISQEEENECNLVINQIDYLKSSLQMSVGLDIFIQYVLEYSSLNLIDYFLSPITALMSLWTCGFLPAVGRLCYLIARRQIPIEYFWPGVKALWRGTFWEPFWAVRPPTVWGFMQEGIVYMWGLSFINVISYTILPIHPSAIFFMQSFLVQPLYDEYFKSKSPTAVCYIVFSELWACAGNPFRIVVAIGHFTSLISPRIGFGFRLMNTITAFCSLYFGFDPSYIYTACGAGAYIFYGARTLFKTSRGVEATVARMILQFGTFLDCGIKGRICFALDKMIVHLNEDQIAVYIEVFKNFLQYRPYAETSKAQALEILDYVQSLNDEILSAQGSMLRFHVAKITACIFANISLGADYVPTLSFLNLINTDDFEKWKKGGSVISIFEFNNSVLTIIRMMIVGDTTIDQINTQQDFVTLVAWCDAHRNLRYDDTGPPIAGRIPDSLFRKKMGLLSDAKKVLKYRRYDSLPPQIYQKACDTLMDIQLMEARVAARNGRRPFVVGITGPPGSGKSTLIAPVLAWHLLKLMGVEKDLSRSREWIFTKTGSSEYWEGYDMLRHHVVVIDELGGVDHKVVSPEWITDLNMVLSEPGCPLNMAFEKGEHFMVAKIIILISNSDDFGVRGVLKDWTSFLRRPDFVFKTMIPAEHSKTHLGIGVNKTTEGINPIEVLNKVKVIPLTATSNGFISMLDQLPQLAGGEPGRVPVVRETITVTEMLTLLKAMFQKHLHEDNSMQTTQVELNDTFIPGVDYSPVVQRLMQLRGIDPSQHVMALSYSMYDENGYDHLAILMNVWIFLGAVFNPLLLLFEKDGLKTMFRPISNIVILVKNPGLTFEYRKLLEYRQSVKDYAARSKYLLYGVGSLMFFGALKLIYDYMQKSEKVEPQAPIKSLTPEEYEKILGEEPRVFSDPTGNPYDMQRGVIFPPPPAGNTPIDIIERKIMRNTLIIQITLGRAKARCHVTGIFSDVYIGPYHSLRLALLPHAIVEVEMFRQVRDGPICGFLTNRVINAVQYVERLNPTSDLALIRLSSVPACLDIRRLTCRMLQFPFGGSMLGRHFYRNDEYRFCQQNSMAKVHRFHYPVTAHEDLTAYNVQTDGLAMETPIPCRNGMCGSPLVVEVQRGVHALVGIYTSGSLQEPRDSVHCFELFSERDMLDCLRRINDRTALMQPLSNITIEESVQIAILDNVLIEPSTNKFDEFEWLNPGDLPNLFFLGHIHVPTQHAKTRVKFTDLADDYVRMLPAEYQTTLVPPIFKPLVDKEKGIYLSPTRHAVLDLSQPARNVNLLHFDAVIRHLSAKYTRIDDFSNDQVINKYAAINGSCKNPYISSMKLNTAMGFPFEGKKNKFVSPAPSDTAPDGVMFDDDILRIWDVMLQTYASGRRCGVIYKGSDKDEPRKLSKVEARQIRKFTCLCLCTLGIEKMYMGIFVGVWLKNFNKCETVGGVNPFSKQWRDVYERLNKFQRGFNGDIKHYDKVVSQLLLLGAFSTIKRIKRHFGFFSHRVIENVIDGIFTDISNPIYLFGRTLFQSNGSVPSGDFLTFFINTIVNQMLIRMAWLHVYCKDEINTDKLAASLLKFEDNVCFVAAGDDNLSTVSDECIESFNFDSAKEFFTSLSIEYTPADKGDVSYRYQSINTLDICKRRFIYNAEFDWVCAPIEKVSITKFLYIHLVSDVISEKQQMEEGIRMIPFELAMHGREEYNRMVPILRELLDKHSLKYNFPTYESMMEYIMQNDENPWLTGQGKPVLEMDEYWLSCDAIANQQVNMVTAIDEFLSTDSESGTLLTDSENLYLQSSSRVLPLTPAFPGAMTQSKNDTSSEDDPNSLSCKTMDS